MPVEWEGDKLIAEFNRVHSDALDAAAIYTVQAVKRKLSRVGTPTNKAGRRALRKARKALNISGGTITSVALPTGSSSTRDKKVRALVQAQTEFTEGLVDPPGGSPRQRTGTLSRSIHHDGNAQLGTGEAKPNSDRRRIGPDLSAPYGAIHEFGGTINHPGGTAYFIGKDGKAVWVSNEKAKPGMARTKPHTIKMPARPYLRPTLIKNKQGIINTYAAYLKQGLGL